MVAEAPTFSSPSMYLSWGGTDGGAAGDIWQCGLHININGDGSPDSAPDPWTAGDLSELWVSTLAPWMADGQSCISAGASLRWVKSATLDIHGKYVGDAVFINPAATAGYSTGYNGASPQDACVYTMWSGETLGKGNYGRIYAPWCTAGVNPATGTFEASVQAGLLSRAVTLLGGIQTYAESKQVDAQIVIMSRAVSYTHLTLPTNREV